MVMNDQNTMEHTFVRLTEQRLYTTVLSAPVVINYLYVIWVMRSYPNVAPLSSLEMLDVAVNDVVTKQVEVKVVLDICVSKCIII